MTHAGYVVAGYGVTFGVLGAYALWVVLRRRALGRLLSTGSAGGPAGDAPDADAPDAPAAAPC